MEEQIIETATNKFIRLLKGTLGPNYRVNLNPHPFPLPGVDILVEFNIKARKYFYKREFGTAQRLEKMLEDLGIEKAVEYIAVEVLLEEDIRKTNYAL